MTLASINDDHLIAAYDAHHRQVWTEVLTSIKEAGIDNMEIYRYNNRLFMIMEVTDQFSFEKKAVSDSENSKFRIENHQCGIIGKRFQVQNPEKNGC